MPFGDGDGAALEFGVPVQAAATKAATARPVTVRNFFTPLPFLSPMVFSLAAYARAPPQHRYPAFGESS
jgi:hypothetical protein